MVLQKDKLYIVNDSFLGQQIDSDNFYNNYPVFEGYTGNIGDTNNGVKVSTVSQTDFGLTESNSNFPFDSVQVTTDRTYILAKGFVDGEPQVREININWIKVIQEFTIPDGVATEIAINPYTNNYNSMPYGSYIYNNLDGTMDISQNKPITEALVQKLIIDEESFFNNCPIKYIKVDEDCIINNIYTDPLHFRSTIRITRYTDGSKSVSLLTGNGLDDDSYTIIAGSAENKIKAIEFEITNPNVERKEPDLPIIFNNKKMLVGLSSSSYIIEDPWSVNPLFAPGSSVQISHQDFRNGLLEEDIGTLTADLNNLLTEVDHMTQQLRNEFTSVKQLYVSR